jgi:hypothetical protein
MGRVGFEARSHRQQLLHGDVPLSLVLYVEELTKSCLEPKRVGRPPVTEVPLVLHLSVLRDDKALQMAKLRSGDGSLECPHRQASRRSCL